MRVFLIMVLGALSLSACDDTPKDDTGECDTIEISTSSSTCEQSTSVSFVETCCNNMGLDYVANYDGVVLCSWGDCPWSSIE